MAQWFENTINSIVRAVVGVAQVSGISKTSDAENMTLDLKPGQALIIDTASGSIQAKPGTNNISSLSYTKTCWGLSDEDANNAFEGVRVTIKETKDGLSVFPEYDKTKSNTNRVSVNIAVVVPPGHHLTARTASGSVEVSGMGNGVKATSASGQVRVDNCTGDVEGNSSSGSVSCSNSSGKIRMSTQSGSTSATNCTGPIELSSVSGSVNISDSSGDYQLNSVSGYVQANNVSVRNYLNAKAVSGFVKVNFKPEPGVKVDARSVSGFVDVTLPPGISVKFDCHSLSGGVDVSLPCSFTLKDHRKAVGTCGPQSQNPISIKAETTSGRVHIGA